VSLPTRPVRRGWRVSLRSICAANLRHLRPAPGTTTSVSRCATLHAEWPQRRSTRQAGSMAAPRNNCVRWCTARARRVIYPDTDWFRPRLSVHRACGELPRRVLFRNEYATFLRTGLRATVWCPPTSACLRATKDVFITEEQGRKFESTEKIKNGASREAPKLACSVDSVVLPCSSVIKTPLVTRGQVVPVRHVCRANPGAIRSTQHPQRKARPHGGWASAVSHSTRLFLGVACANHPHDGSAAGRHEPLARLFQYNRAKATVPNKRPGNRCIRSAGEFQKRPITHRPAFGVSRRARPGLPDCTAPGCADASPSQRSAPCS